MNIPIQGNIPSVTLESSLKILNIPSFSEWLKLPINQNILEQAKALEGDLEDYRVDAEDLNKMDQDYITIRQITPTALRTQWTFYGYVLDKNKKQYTVYNRGNTSFIIVEPSSVDKDYLIITEATLQNEPSFKQKFQLPNAYRVFEIISIPKYRGSGLGLSLYKLWVQKGLNIFGDFEQYFGARKIWSKLSKEADVTVDIVDIVKGIYLEQNTTIYHGDFDEEFDDRVWSSSDEKYNIRLLLKNIEM